MSERHSLLLSLQTQQPQPFNHQTDGKFQHSNIEGADHQKNCYSDNKILLDFVIARSE